MTCAVVALCGQPLAIGVTLRTVGLISQQEGLPPQSRGTGMSPGETQSCGKEQAEGSHHHHHGHVRDTTNTHNRELYEIQLPPAVHVIL